MEEILASIRKIISEDSTEAPAPANAAPAAPPAHEADVLELTQEFEEPPPPARPEPVRAAAPPPRPEPDVVFQDEAPTPQPVPSAPAAVAAPAPAAQDDIFSDKTRKAIQDAGVPIYAVQGQRVLEVVHNIAATAQSVREAPLPSLLTPQSQTILDKLASLSSLPKPDWSYHTGDLQHGESPSLDDTSWQSAAGTLPVRSITDRAIAIDEAIAQAQPGDVLVIAGKGHEQGQEFAGGRKLPFDDATVARKALRVRGSRR